MNKPVKTLSLSITCLLAALTPLPAAEPMKATDDSLPIHLGVVENFTTADGSHLTMVLPFFHRFTNPDGSTNSFSLLNYLQWPNTTAVLPLYVRTGADGQKHTWLIPLWCQGPGYAGAPLALSGGWTTSDGGRALWITPFMHVDTRADGTVEDAHALTYFQGQHHQVLFPLAYRTGLPERQYQGIIPLVFAGPDWWTAPLTLSGGWQHDGGGRTDWVTPLYHRSTDPTGATTSLHLLNYVHTPDTDVVFPLIWHGGTGTNSYTGVLPLWWQGAHGGCAPALLSAWWRNDRGGTTIWATPLAHASTNGTGEVTDFHVLNYVHSRQFDLLFPLAWSSGSGDDRSTVVLPLYWQNRNHQVLLPLFYRIGSGDDRQVGVFPFWFQGKNHLVIPPYYCVGSAETGYNRGVFPVWFQGDGWWFVPPLLTGRSAHADGSSLWVTPLFHEQQHGSDRSFHCLTYFSGHHGGGTDAKTGKPLPESSYHVAFPLFYRTSSSDEGITSTHTGVIPFYFGGPDSWFSPLAWSGSWTSNGETTTWITPLYHQTSRADGSHSMHALIYSQGTEHGQPNAKGQPCQQEFQTLFPLYFHRSATADGLITERTTVFPLWYSSSDCTLVPPLLSARLSNADGGDSLWLTPLFHRTLDQHGNTTSLHALNYVQVGERKMLFPLAYSSGGDHAQRGVIPLWFSGPEYWTVPLALSGGWKRNDGGSATWITPLAHVDRDQAGRMERLHVLTYFHDRDNDILFPLAWRSGADGQRHSGLLPLWLQGPEYWTMPLALSGGWTNADGGKTTWITPLAHHRSDQLGNTTSWHALNFFHFGDTDLLAPLAWRSGPVGQRHGAVFPLYWQGPDYCVLAPLYLQSQHSWIAPLALSARWNDGPERTTTVVTPLYHRTTDHGQVAHEHLLNYVSTPQLTTVLPLYWDWKNAAGSRTSMLPPLYVDHRRTDGERITAVVPPLLTYRSGKEVDTTLGFKLLPFLWQQADDGYEVNVLWRCVHVREKQQTTDTAVWPLWWSEHRAKTPTRWQILGGLIAHENNEETKTSRFYLFWMPIGSRQSFAPTTPSASPTAKPAS